MKCVRDDLKSQESGPHFMDELLGCGVPLKFIRDRVCKYQLFPSLGGVETGQK